jgi:hypothetical protein
MRKLPPVPPLDRPIAIHLTAVYRTAAALLRELSRAVSRGATRLRAESGLPVGSRLTVGLVTAGLEKPIEVSGIVTSNTRKGRLFEMQLRYDFDPAQSRRLLADTVAVLEKQDPMRGPRRTRRLPVALPVDTDSLARSLTTTLANLSPTGCRLELSGRRIPPMAVGDRLRLALAGSGPGLRRVVRLGLDLRWVRAARAAGGRRRIEVGGRFFDLTPRSRARITAIVRLRDFRPRIQVLGIVRLPRAPRGVR